MPAFESWAAAAGAAVLLPFGGYLLATSARWLRRIRGSRTWVETPCEVESIRAVGVEDYEVEITFAYAVGAATYRSDRYSFAAGVAVTDAHQVAARHPAGSRAVCYVNPADPADAVFVRSANVLPTLLLLAAGGIATGCGVFLAWHWATG